MPSTDEMHRELAKNGWKWHKNTHMWSHKHSGKMQFFIWEAYRILEMRKEEDGKSK